jgi:hypothetical protein
MARKKKLKDKGILTYFPPKRRKDIRALIRALGLVFVKAEPTRLAHQMMSQPP